MDIYIFPKLQPHHSSQGESPGQSVRGSSEQANGMSCPHGERYSQSQSREAERFGQNWASGGQ